MALQPLFIRGWKQLSAYKRCLLRMAKHLNLSPRKNRLCLYINKVESLRGYIVLLRSCKTARDLGEVVATMCQQEPSLTDELIVKQSFISLLLPFVPTWAKGQTIDNIRVAINNAWAARKKALRQSGRQIP